MFKTTTRYGVFISHSWTYNEQYDTVQKWLNESNIQISNYSVSSDKAFDSITNRTLKEKIKEQISHASVVIILAGMYATHSPWIDYEIETAYRMHKPILGIEPWGQTRVPQKIQDYSRKIVGWNAKSVVEGFKSLV